MAAEDSIFTWILDVVDTRQSSRYKPTDLFSPDRDNVLKVYIVPREVAFLPSCEMVSSVPYYELREFAVVIAARGRRARRSARARDSAFPRRSLLERLVVRRPT
jgi:hypothetical protein